MHMGKILGCTKLSFHMCSFLHDGFSYGVMTDRLIDSPNFGMIVFLRNPKLYLEYMRNSLIESQKFLIDLLKESPKRLVNFYIYI